MSRGARRAKGQIIGMGRFTALSLLMLSESFGLEDLEGIFQRRRCMVLQPFHFTDQRAKQLFGQCSPSNLFLLLSFALNRGESVGCVIPSMLEAQSEILSIARYIYFLLMIPEADFGFNRGRLAKHRHSGL